MIASRCEGLAAFQSEQSVSWTGVAIVGPALAGGAFESEPRQPVSTAEAPITAAQSTP